MAKPKIPNQKKKYKELNGRLSRYVALIGQIYDTLNLEAAKVVSRTDYSSDSEKPFKWSDYPETKKQIDDIQAQFVSDINAVIYRGTSEEWKNSNAAQDLIADKVLKAYTAQVDREKYKVLYQTNSDALKAFRKRKDKGLNVSAKLWNQSVGYKRELEEAISCAIQKGTSAVTLSKQISKYLQDFPSLQKDYKERYGTASRAADCEYRSIRLARSEINMAYRTAENERWKQMDFVVGYEIKTSTSHFHRMPKGDICDDLAGKYPKDFAWTGWHPNCYSDDSEVLTSRGWKLFKDVLDDDLILSLNPNERVPEWVGFTDIQCYPHSGNMIHFFNKSLDCLVTPDHNMVYLNKNDGRIKNCQAKEYTKGKGGFYRGCEYESDDVEFYQIDDLIIPFDFFCEFMGYWLSDGSTMSNSGVVISQQEGEAARNKIVDCIKRMGFEPHLEKQKVVFYNTTMRNYLMIFGQCINKFVPYVVKNASKRQIRIFLDAFVLCDGYKRPCKSFIGNHGNEFRSDKEEIVYFTTSERMAGDLSELILKSGHRPSFHVNRAGISHKTNGSIIKSNYDCYSIRECYSVTSSVFNKEILHYDGLVYDLTLERNHIMYIRRNGKCFWGSNCLCYKIPILKTEEEFWEWDGRSEVSTSSVNEVKDVPDAFKQWIDTNSKRIDEARKHGTLPYFIKDNREKVDAILNPKQKTLTTLEKARIRQSGRTPEQVEKIQEDWNRHRLQQFENAIDKGLLPEQARETLQWMRDSNDLGDFDDFKRRASILDKAVKRHEARTQEEIDEIYGKLAKRDIGVALKRTSLKFKNPDNITDKEVKDVIKVFAQNNPDMFLGGLADVGVTKAKNVRAFMFNRRLYNSITGEYIEAKGNTIFFVNKDLSRSDGTIFNALKEVKGAFRSISLGQDLTFKQEYALESLWHEMRHAQAVGFKNVNRQETLMTASMETINQFCARHSYGHFVRSLGGKAIHTKEVIERGYGYSMYVRNFQRLLDSMNVTQTEAYTHFKNIIIKTPYEDIYGEIVKFVQKRGGYDLKTASDIAEKMVTKSTQTFSDVLDALQ